MHVETQRPVGYLRPNDEVLHPQSHTWRVVQSVTPAEAEEDDEYALVEVTFTDGDQLAFMQGFVVTVRTPSTPVAPRTPVGLAPALPSPPSSAPPQAPVELAPAPPLASRIATSVVQAAALEGEIIVETRALVRDYQAMHAVEVDERGTALRVLCGTVRVEDMATSRRFAVPTCRRCVNAEVLPVRCPKTSRRWFDLEMRRMAAEANKVWYDAKERAERDAEAKRAEAAEAKRREEQRAWSEWRQAQHVSLSPPEREWAEDLRRDWGEHGQEPEEELIHSAVGDCGRKHLSLAAACACANVRRGATERQASARLPTSAPRPPIPPTRAAWLTPATQTHPAHLRQPMTGARTNACKRRRRRCCDPFPRQACR